MNRYTLIAWGGQQPGHRPRTKLAVQDSPTTVTVLRVDPWVRTDKPRFYSRPTLLSRMQMLYQWEPGIVPGRAEVRRIRSRLAPVQS